MTPTELRTMYDRALSARNQGDTEAFSIESDILTAIPAIAAAWEKAERDREALLTVLKNALPYLRQSHGDGLFPDLKPALAAIAQAEEKP